MIIVLESPSFRLAFSLVRWRKKVDSYLRREWRGEEGLLQFHLRASGRNESGFVAPTILGRAGSRAGTGPRSRKRQFLLVFRDRAKHSP